MGILSQNAVPDALPDFRNLGVLARAMVAVNAAAFVAAAIRSENWSQFVTELIEIAALVEPALLLSLVTLYAAHPALAKLPYARGLATTGGIVLLATTAVYATLARTGASLEGAVRAGAFALALAGVLAAYFHLRNRAFSPALAEARLQALQARIRPHFLFNSLNAVLSLIRTDAKRAEGAIEDLAELYRMLMADTRTLTPLAEELELTRQYLNLEQLRLGERLIIDWQIDAAARDALVPPLFLQPLVENAVYHGIEPGIGPGSIEVAIRLDRDRLHILLRNPYHPEYQHRQGNRMALANIRERLALHFDVEATLEQGVKGENYEIHIAMPYRRAV